MLRNTIKDHWQKEQLPIGSYLRTSGMEIRYEANESSSIDPERVLDLFEKEEITRDQLLRMISIGAAEAKNILGADQVADFTVKDIGKKLDVRLTDLPVENIKDEYVMENSNVRKRFKRRVFGGGKKVERTSSGKPKRRIKTRTRQ